MKAHICSLDGQVWRIVEQGPYKIVDKEDPSKDKKPEDYTDADYKAMEKNHRAMKVILSALSEGDKKVVTAYDSAKDMWDALKNLHVGNEDIKRNRILVASRDYERAVQGKNESLHDFHSWFMGYVGQLKFLGEHIPEWKITRQFMQALNPQWDGIAVAFQAQTDIKKIKMEELVARL